MKYLVQAGLSLGVASLSYVTPLQACDVTFPASPPATAGQEYSSSALQSVIDQNPGREICLQPDIVIETGGQGNNPLLITQDTRLTGLPGAARARIQNSLTGNGYDLWYTAIRQLASSLSLKNLEITNKSSVAAILVNGGELHAAQTSIRSSGSGGKGVEFRTAGEPSSLRGSEISCSGTDCRAIKATNYAQVEFNRVSLKVTGPSGQGIQALDHASVTGKRMRVEVDAPYAKAITLQQDSRAELQNLLIYLNKSFTRGITTIGDAALNKLKLVRIFANEPSTQPIGLVHESRVAIPEVDRFRFEAVGSDGARAMFLQGNTSTLYNQAFDAVIQKVSNFSVLLDSATSVAFGFNALPGGNPANNDSALILEMRDGDVVATEAPTLYNFSDAPSQIIVKDNVTFNGAPVS
jgi:hypothetical protein